MNLASLYKIEFEVGNQMDCIYFTSPETNTEKIHDQGKAVLSQYLDRPVSVETDCVAIRYLGKVKINKELSEDRFIALFYLLLRDNLSVGTLIGQMNSSEGAPFDYTNKELQVLATSLVRRMK